MKRPPPAHIRGNLCVRILEPKRFSEVPRVHVLHMHYMQGGRLCKIRNENLPYT